DVAQWSSGFLSVAGEVFAHLATLQRRRFITERFTAVPVSTEMFYQHFLDFYRQDGFGAMVLMSSGQFNAALGVQQYSITNMPTIQANERINIPAQAGDYRVLQAEATWNMQLNSSLLPIVSPPLLDDPRTTVRGAIIGRIGHYHQAQGLFGTVEVRAEFLQPTFYTGYAPMFLRLYTHLGYASNNAPLQEQWIAFRRLAVGGRPTDLATIPINGLAGTQYGTLHIEHNCSDMLWRALSLPTWKGRGLDISILANLGYYRQQSFATFPRLSEYGEQAFAPSSDLHTELGVGLSRIPSFFSDFVHFRLDLLWGIGRSVLPGNNFGFAVSCTVPLSD
ncbi:MAG: hypothetical protein RML40_07575, partial [Bacteroidota bacterium]|nr:hypothetical protein [Candidatus Kapabacteria bacterium]MDW8220374.1 hypothetical protein [Bacteroidota bacterium]